MEDESREPAERPAWTWIVPVVLVSALVLVGVVVLRVRSNAPETPELTMEETARMFLVAVSESRAADALAMAATPQEGPYLTDAVLRVSMANAPISDIRVAGVEGDVVRLAHRLGDTDTTTSVRMVRHGEAWQVDRAAASVRVAPTPELIPVVVDGTEARSTGARSDSATYDVLLFPGEHTLATGSAWIDYTAPTFQVTDLTDAIGPDATAGPTSGAADAVHRALLDRLDECVASGELAPGHRCPWNLTGQEGQTVDPASVTLSVTGEPQFQAPTLDGHDALATGRFTFTLHVEAEITLDGGGRQHLSQDVPVDTGYRADLLTDAPDFIWTD